MTEQRRSGAAYGKHRTSQRAWRTTRVWARRNLPPICGLCQCPIDLSLNYRDPMAWTLDHIIPVNVGGTNARNNLQPAHRSCNGAKGDGTRPGNPRGDRWQNAPTPGNTQHQRPGHNTSARRGNYVSADKRVGPEAKDRRAFVYGPQPATAVMLSPDGEQHIWELGPSDALTHWQPGQAWPPQLNESVYVAPTLDW